MKMWSGSIESLVARSAKVVSENDFEKLFDVRWMRSGQIGSRTILPQD